MEKRFIIIYPCYDLIIIIIIIIIKQNKILKSRRTGTSYLQRWALRWFSTMTLMADRRWCSRRSKVKMPWPNEWLPNEQSCGRISISFVIQVIHYYNNSNADVQSYRCWFGMPWSWVPVRHVIVCLCFTLLTWDGGRGERRVWPCAPII